MKVITNNNIKSTVALAALQDVMDPEIGLNVVDLGLIYQVDFDDDKSEIYVLMTLTTQFCPMGQSITTGVKSALERVFTGNKVDVQLTFDPPWSYELISDDGKEFLNR